MYTRRAALVKFNSLRPLLKVCRTRTPDFLYPVNALASVRNVGTATERSDAYSNLDGNVAEDNSGNNNYNRNHGFYGTSSGGVEQNQNPTWVHGQSLSGQYGGFAAGFSDSQNVVDGIPSAQNHSYNYGSVNSRFGDRNVGGVEYNQNPRGFHGQNANLNGYGGSVTGIPPQNHGGVLPQSPRGHFDGKTERFQMEFGGSYGGNADMPVPTVPSAGMYQQNESGNHYFNEGNSMRSWGEFRGDGIIDSQVPHAMRSNAESVEVAEVSQARQKIEDLDELIKEGKIKEAVEILELLENDGLQVDLPRYLTLMKACGENEALEEAKVVHEHLLKSMPHLDVRTYNKILEMYSKCGSMDNAFKVFDQMPKRNLTSWDVMIYWLAKNGCGEDSLELFEEFKRSGLKPDGQMFLGVFSACGVLCDTIEGMLHFESMMKDYDIVPSMEHYIGIIAMLGSAGCLDEALEFIENMPVEPSIDIWETLMKFSRIHGNLELGDRCAGLVQLLDCSRLNDQSRAGLIPINASDLEREKVKKKLSGQNLLDVRSRVHEYRAGDRSHPDHERIYTLLRGLKQQMKEVGYVPETKFVLHDVDQESKEEALMAHSERLAAAQGFLTSAARSQLRIIKNLRVCGDCHNAFKIISKIVGRQIIARDSKRFHHFENGSCSCNDYW